VIAHLRREDADVVAHAPGGDREVVDVLLNATQRRVVVLGDDADLH